jgi:hypothetical protein
MLTTHINVECSVNRAGTIDVMVVSPALSTELFMMEIIGIIYWVRKKDVPYLYTIRCKCWYEKVIYCKRYATTKEFCKECIKKRKRLANIYSNILERCLNKESCNYRNYWWRWIKCLRRNKEDFIRDMEEWYIYGLSIDRINNNWNYCKENCKRATQKEQMRNTRCNVIHNWKCLAERSETLWIPYDNVYYWIVRSKENSVHNKKVKSLLSDNH